MIREELNLNNWQMVLLLAVMLVLSYAIAKIKPKNSFIEFKNKTECNSSPSPLQERYGAYIQSQGRYYN